MVRKFSGPLLPGTTSVRQVNRRNKNYKKVSYKPGMRGLTKMVKAISLRQCETKKSNQYSTAGVSLFHNLAFYVPSLQSTEQGVSDPQGSIQDSRNRIGDEVIARGIKLKWFLENIADRPNVMYRIHVFRYNTLEVPLSDNYFWAGTDSNGGNMNRMLDKPNVERIKVIKEIMIKPTYQANYSVDPQNKVKTNFVECWIPLKNRKVKYNDDNSNDVRYTDIGFAVTTYDAINTAQTDQLANLQWSSCFYFKDP